jgi:hypothetical protein
VRVRPRIERASGKLRPVVDDDGLRQSDLGVQAVEHACDAESGERAVHFDRDALPREIVHDVQRPEASVGQGIDREIHRPPFLSLARRRQGHALRSRQPLPPPASYLEVGRAIDAMRPFVIHDQAVPLEQNVYRE